MGLHVNQSQCERQKRQSPQVAGPLAADERCPEDTVIKEKRGTQGGLSQAGSSSEGQQKGLLGQPALPLASDRALEGRATLSDGAACRGGALVAKTF